MLRSTGQGFGLVKLTDAKSWRERRADKDGAQLIAHEGTADIAGLGSAIEVWLKQKGLDTETVAGDCTCVVKAEAPAGWKKSIGASPSVEVEISDEPAGTKVEVHPGRAGGAVWTARYFTYSWVAFGFSYMTLKADLLEFVRGRLREGTSPLAGAPKVLGVVETARSEQRLGSEDRDIDNRQSDTTVTRSFKATKRWTQSCQVELEKSRVSGQSADVTIPNLVSLKGDVEETLRRQYSASTEEEQTFEEEVTVTVPPRTGLHLVIDWKRIVQEGYVRLAGGDGQVVEVPFQLAVGVTFDQRQSGELNS
jgi:hypothetical protein